MTEVLIEENFVHIDGGDMAVILAIVDRLGLGAEPTAPRHVSERHTWVLALHWLTADRPPAELSAALPGAFAEIRRHYLDAGKVPPARLAVYGPNEVVLSTVE